MNKMFRILEIVWLIIGIVGAISSIYSLIRKDYTEATYFLIFTFIAGIMYVVRKRQRKKMSNNNNQN